MNHPSVDVVIATHQRPELLARAMAAVKEQDYEGVVHVHLVYDQAEPDVSWSSQDTLRPVSVHVNGRTPGLAGARNTGVGAGTAELIAFCDDDDWWRADKVRRQVDLMSTSEYLTVVSGINIQYGDHATQRIPTAEEMTVPTLIRRRVMAAHPSSVMVRREAFEGPIGQVDETIPGSFAEDYDWILRAAKAGPIGVVGEPLVEVAWGQSLFTGKWATVIAALDHLIDNHPEFRDDEHALARIRGQQAFGLAALGQRSAAWKMIRRALSLNVTERRAWVATAVNSGVVTAPWVMDQLHRRGRGI